jgi:sugar lactone lactonase YvrE
MTPRQRMFQLGVSAVITLTLSAQSDPFSDRNWTPIPGATRPGDAVNVVLADGKGGAYAGGQFISMDGALAFGVAHWDGSQWSTLGSGVQGPAPDGSGPYVAALAFDPAGDLIVGGAFRSAGGVSANSIAKWDGRQWTALGDGVDGTVSTVVSDKLGNIFIGGGGRSPWSYIPSPPVAGFTHAGGVPALNIAKWNGAAWSALGAGFECNVYALALDGSGRLLAGGDFTVGASTNASGVAVWDGAAWSPVGALQNQTVFTLAVDSAGRIYEGGAFNPGFAHGSAVPCAMWDGARWQPMGSGAANPFSFDALAVDAGGNVFAAAQTVVPRGGYLEARLLRWDGSIWLPMGSGVSADFITSFISGVNSLSMDSRRRMFAGGAFDTLAGLPSPNLAVADLSVFQPARVVFQPVDAPSKPGGTASLSIQAAGDPPLAYSWWFNGALLAGATNARLTIPALGTNNLGPYFCIVTNAWGSVTSTVAHIRFGAPPTIVAQPTDASAPGGAYVSFSVAAAGPGPLTYRWLFNGTFMAPEITTVAGDGKAGDGGDGLPGLSASLTKPVALACDAVGDVFITDSTNNRVRRLDASGVIRAFAGNGVAGFSGDGGPAVNASLNTPGAIAVAPDGSLYIADKKNLRVRRVDPGGIITTVAGTGVFGSGGDGGPATAANLQELGGIAVAPDGGLCLIDLTSAVIRRIETNGTITSIAAKGLGSPYCIAFTPAGDLLVSDQYSGGINRISSDGVITTVAGLGSWVFPNDGAPAAASAWRPVTSMAVAPDGDVFLLDGGAGGIRKIDPLGRLYTLNSGRGVGFSGDHGDAALATFFYPAALVLNPAGDIYVADSDNQVVRKITSVTSPTLTLGPVSWAETGNYQVIVQSPFGVATSSVASLAHTIPPEIGAAPPPRFATAGSKVSISFPVTGPGPLSFTWLRNGARLPGQTGSALLLTNASPSDSGLFSVIVSNPSGAVTSAPVVVNIGFAPSITNQPSDSTNLAGSSLNLSVGVAGSGPFEYRWRFNGEHLDGVITTVAGWGPKGYFGDGGDASNAQFNLPEGVAADAAGNIYIADTRNSVVRRVGRDGVITTIACVYWPNGFSNANSGDGGLAIEARLLTPQGLAVDSSGNIFISDSNQSAIRRISPDGLIATFAGTGVAGFSGDGGPATNAALRYPSSVAVDPAGGLFIADSGNNRIRHVNATGLMSTVAGFGKAGYSGDGGPAVNAALLDPSGVSVDPAGNVYIADTGNRAIRVVRPGGVIESLTKRGGALSALSNPVRLVTDGLGAVLVADSYRNQIFRVDAYGDVSPVAGDGQLGYFGDGGAATSAKMDYVGDIAIAPGGDILIADSGNNVVRRVSRPGPSLASLGPAAAKAGVYDVIVSSPYGSVTSAVVHVTVVAPVSITVQPTPVFAHAGAPAMFSVQASGTPPPAFQWLFDGQPVSGATNALLQIPSVAPTNAGAWSVVVANAYGAVTSDPAPLLVGDPPSITTQPVGGTFETGGSPALSVAVSGEGPISYQWRLNGTNVELSQIVALAASPSNAPFKNPSALAVDASGNVYVADTGHNKVRRISVDGAVSDFAGTGVAGDSGDGGPALSAELNRPAGVAVNAFGDLYIADGNNNRVRKVSATDGSITTFAGVRLPSNACVSCVDFSGDGGPALNANLRYPAGLAFDQAGNLYISDVDNYAVRRINPVGAITTVAGTGSPGVFALAGLGIKVGLGGVGGLATDAAGDLFIAESRPLHAIDKLSPNGWLEPAAGAQGTACAQCGLYPWEKIRATNLYLYSPVGVAAAPDGRFWFTDSESGLVREVTPAGFTFRVAGGGRNPLADGVMATNISFNPGPLALDPAGNLIVADSDSGRLWKIILPGASVSLRDVTPAFSGLYDVVVSNPFGSVTSAVARIDVTAVPSFVDRPADQTVLEGSNVSFTAPAFAIPAPTYQWYFGPNPIPDATNAALTLSKVLRTAAGGYFAVAANPLGVVTSSVAALTIVPSPQILSQPVELFAAVGRPATFSVGATSTVPVAYQWLFNGAPLPGAVGPVLTFTNITPPLQGDYSVLLTDAFGAVTSSVARLHVGDAPSIISPPAAATVLLGRFVDFSVKAAGAAPLTYTWRLNGAPIPGGPATFAGNGVFAFAGDGGSAVAASLDDPMGLALDSTGNVYIADFANDAVRKVDRAGVITSVVGTGVPGFSGDGRPAVAAQLDAPSGLAFDAAGNLFVVDGYNDVIRKIDLSGVINTVAGSPRVAAFHGDGGPATNAALNSPTGLAFDASGDLFIADTFNHRIRRVDSNGLITTFAGDGRATFAGDGGPAASASLDAPTGLAFDAFGNAYVADAYNGRVRKIDAHGVITTFAGGGNNLGNLATNITLNTPVALALD